MFDYFVHEFEDGEKFICAGDAQEVMSLEQVAERLNEYESRFEPVEYEHKNMKELINVLYACENDYANKKHDLEQEKINLWFNEDWATKLDKAKPSEKDKEKAITNMLSDKILEVKQLEANLNLLKRQYETALRYSYEVIK